MSAGDWKRFYQAVCDGDMRLVRHYIEAGIDVNYAHPEFFSTPLVASRSMGEAPSTSDTRSGSAPRCKMKSAFKNNWTAWGLPPGLPGISGNAGWAGSGSAGPHRPLGGSTRGARTPTQLTPDTLKSQRAPPKRITSFSQARTYSPLVTTLCAMPALIFKALVIYTATQYTS